MPACKVYPDLACLAPWPYLCPRTLCDRTGDTAKPASTSDTKTERREDWKERVG